MNITYVKHSCFTIEIENDVLIFDYFQGDLPDFPENKKIYVFASHFHHDHFDFCIFKLLKQYPDVTYILSKDIKKKYSRNYMLNHGFRKFGIPDEKFEQIHFIGADASLSIGNLEVKTLNSTDSGVAFLVDLHGKSIYHAGDLNWWTWKGETRREYEDMTKRFQNEIQKIEGRHFDVAFLPLDPRQEEKFYLGFDYFMRHTNTDLAFPMHFWGDNSVINRLLSIPCAKEYKEKVAYVED